jgi:hypothetical protein
MATPASRYTVNTPNTTDNIVNSVGSATTNTSSVGTTDQTQTSDSTTNSKQTTKSLDPKSQAALDSLIKQLLAGGTPEMRQATAQRQREIATDQGTRAAYSKEAAFGDAQGLISQQMRRTLETLLPSINRAAEDAGSSGGALRALLLQDAASKAAESSSALGVQTAVNYGNINANLSQVLERLTQSDPTTANTLIAALNVAKGANVTTTGSSSTSGTVNTQGTTTQQQQGSTTEQKNMTTDYAPFSQSLVAPNSPTAPIYFGPSAPAVDGSKYIGTTLDTLSQLAGTGSPWNSYTF